jgi:hypothetical protein
MAGDVMIAGICGNCNPIRPIKILLGPLIERYGPDVKTRDVMDRITCAACGAKMPVSLVPISTRPKGYRHRRETPARDAW